MVPDFSKAIALGVADWRIYGGLGRAHAQLGDLDAAKAAMSKAVGLGRSLDPERPNPVAFELRYQQALLQLATGDERGYRGACRDLLRVANRPEYSSSVATICLLGRIDFRPRTSASHGSC